MLFLISFGIAVLFISLADKALRANPVPFYAGAVILALTAAAVTWSGAVLPEAAYVWPVLARGGLAGALFILVMFAGALPNGSALIKKLMPIRGQLSILASILTLGHNAAYGKVYFVRLFTAPASLPVNQLFAAVCSVLMLAIMLPLFVTSFRCVRKRMRPKSWKRLQRWAYGFYGLLACHILLLTVPGALRGDISSQMSAFAYGTVFLSYLFCRTGKALAKQKVPAQLLARKQIGAVLCCALISAGAVLWMGTAKQGSSTAGPSQGTNSSAAALSESNDDTSFETTGMTQPSGTAAPEGYPDGVYTGSAMGMNAKIEVRVTVEGGQIADISIESARDDEPYFSDALEVIQDILAANSTQVDAVSGATYSSGGILGAVDDALKHAGG